jgi:hypothetical protein
MTSLPFRTNHPLAQQVFKRQLVPEPGQAPQPAVGDAPAPAPLSSTSVVEQAETGDDDGGVNVGVVVGPIAAGVALVLAGVLAAVFVKRQRAKKRRRQALAAGDAPEVRSSARLTTSHNATCSLPVEQVRCLLLLLMCAHRAQPAER